jgi:hypothetical protein
MGRSAHHDYRYAVIDTDYENYALVYSCLNFNSKIGVNAFILSRKRYLDGTQVDLLKRILNRKYSTDSSKFQKVEQSDCN